MLTKIVTQPLVFDDDSIDDILYGAEGQAASDADVFEAWRSGGELTPENSSVVASILARKPSLSERLAHEKLAHLLAALEKQVESSEEKSFDALFDLACVYFAARQDEQAQAWYQKALAIRDAAGPLLREKCDVALQERGYYFDQRRKLPKASEGSVIKQDTASVADYRQENLVVFRALALDLFMAEKYHDAEEIYVSLLKREYQIPGTLTHLARVLLMQDKIVETRKALASAVHAMRNKELCAVTPTYVSQRIIFLQILCAMLARKKHMRLKKRLKRELQRTANRQLWTIEPVIEHFEDRLRPEGLRMLRELAGKIDTAG